MRFVTGLALTAFIFIQSAAHATSGNWNTNATGIWSDAANWNPAVVPGTSAGDVVGLTFNIDAARTNTIDGAVASRTVGTLNIGDPTTGFFAYTLAASGGGTLTFNNGGSSANLVQSLTTASDLISAPLILADNLSVNNSSTLTLSGIIGDGGAGKGITKTGTGTLILSGTNTYSGGTMLNTGTMTLQFGTGNNVSGVIGSSSALTLGGTSTLSVLGGATAIADSQAFNGTTLSGGQPVVLLTKNTATSVTLNMGTLVNSAKSYLNFTIPSATTVTVSRAALDASGALLGAWASVGSGTTLGYAADNNVVNGNITAYSSATAATVADLSNVISPTANYKYAAAATLVGNQTGNTLQYTGAAAATALGTNSLTLNGLMNAGTGLLTLSGTAATPGLVIGSGGELDLIANTQGMTVSSVISGTGALVYGGPSAGTLTLSGANTFDGGTFLNGGTLSVSADSAFGTVPVTATTNLIFGGNSTLKATSSFTLNANRNIVINNGVNATFDNPGLTVSIDGVISGLGSLTKAKQGTLYLRGANTYSGGTYIIADGGGVGGAVCITSDASLGAAPTTPTPNLFFPSGYQTLLTWLSPFDLNPNRTIVATGTATFAFYNNHNIKLANLITGSGSLSLTPSGTGSVTLSNTNNTFTGKTSVTGILKIGSDSVLGTPPASPATSVDGWNGTMQLLASFDLHPKRNIGNAGVGGSGSTFTIDTQGYNMMIPGSANSGAHNFTKAGSGTLTLAGNNTFSTQTFYPLSINGGLLRMNGTSTGAQLNINKSGALGGTGTISMLVTAAIGDAANAGGAIRLADGAVGTLTLATNLTFSGTVANPNSLSFDLGNTGFSDKIMVGGSHSAVSPAGSALVYLNQLPGTTGAGTYTLIQANLASVTNGYALATTCAGRYVYALGASGNNLQVNVSAGDAGPTNDFVYWKGDTALWNTAQWYADSDGTVPTNRPGYSSNVRFAAATPANLTNNLGQNFEINSLTVNSGLGAVMITNANYMLTIDATADNGNTAGNGITVNNAAGTTISAKVGLASNQTWTVGSGAALTVSGGIADGGAGYLLTKADAGILTFTGPNTYVGGTTVSGGTLQIGAGGTAGMLSPVGNILNNATMLFNRSDALTQGIGFGDISGSGTIAQVGTGTLTLNRSNTYTGQTKISAGTLSVGATENLGAPSATLVFDGGTLQITASALTSFSGIGHPVVFTAAKTVGMDINVAANVFTADQVLDQTTGGLTKLGLGTLVLSAANTYSGVTIISNGVLRLTHANALPGGIGSTGGTGALTFDSVDTDGSPGAIYTGVIGLGNGDFSRPLAAAGTVGAVTFTGAGGWAAFGADRSVNLGGASAQVPWATSGTGLNAKTLVLGAASATHTVDFKNPLDLGTSPSTRTIQVDNGAADIDAKLSGVLSGTAGLNIYATGTLALAGPNTYSGATYLGSGGTLVVSSFNSVNTDPGLGTVRSASSSLGSPATAPNGLLTLGGGNNNYAGAILRYTGTGETTDRGIYLKGQNTTYTIDQSGTGLLKFVTPITLASGYNHTLVLQGSTNGTGEIAANIPPSGAGKTTSVTKAGEGAWRLSGANTYAGPTTVNAGTLKAGIASVAGVSGPFGTNSAVTLANTAGAVLDITGYDTEIGSLAGGGTTGGNVTLGTAALTVGRNNTSTTYAGSISGTGGRLVKIGTGTNTLTGASSYSGGTTVSGGALLVNSAGTLGSGDVTVTSGAVILNSGTAIDDAKRLTIADGGGAKVSVAAGITETVNVLFFGTKQQAAGTWGTTGVDHADTDHFSGTGKIRVLKGPSGTLFLVL